MGFWLTAENVVVTSRPVTTTNRKGAADFSPRPRIFTQTVISTLFDVFERNVNRSYRTVTFPDNAAERRSHRLNARPHRLWAPATNRSAALQSARSRPRHRHPQSQCG